MNYKKRRIATIDLGTNSLLMLVAERDESGKITVLDDQLETPRIGENLRSSGIISNDALDRTCKTLETLAARVKNQNVESLHITATSAVREAKNQVDVLNRLGSAAGTTHIEVITPNEEARLTYVSVTSERGHEDPSLVVDIGGGSTEVTWGLGPRFDGGRSLKFGTVKLFEGPLQSQDCPTPAMIEAARKEIDTYLLRVTPLDKLDHYYGTAGSFTHLAALDLKLSTYSSDAVDGHILTPEIVSAWIDRLIKMPREEKNKLPGADPRRVDLLIAGSLIIERLFKKLGNPSFIVIDRGIRYGKLFDVLRSFVPPVHFPAKSL